MYADLKPQIGAEKKIKIRENKREKKLKKFARR